MFRLKTRKRLRFELRRCAVLVAAAGLLAVFVEGAAGAVQPSFVLSAVAAAGSRVVDVGVADFNGDGKPDLAVASSYPHEITVLLGDGAGGFQPGPRFARQDRPPTRLFTADFNGDGKIDLAVSQRDVSLFGVGWVSILLGNGAGRFSAAAGSPLELAELAELAGLAAVSDVNADGKADLVLLQEGRVAVLLGDGSGHFTPVPGSPYAAATYPRAVAVADLNGDEKPDLVVVPEQGGLWILLGTGSGRFAAARKVTTASGPLAVGDFNGDKKQDLAVAGTKLSILLGSGAGGFSPAPGSPVQGDYRNGIATADVNGDGKADLAAASYKSVLVLLGDGAGRFHRAGGSPLGLSLPFYPSLRAATDLNGDGKPDLLARATVYQELGDVAEEGEQRLAILLQASSVPAPAVRHGRALPGSPEVRFTTRGTITTLAADGDRAAACSAGRVVVWTASTRKATDYLRGCFDVMALGGGQVAWIVGHVAGNTEGWLDVFAAKLSGGAARRIDGSARARTDFSDGGLWMGHLLGGGPLLAYNRWTTACTGGPPDYGCIGCCPPPAWLRVATKSLVRVIAGRRVVVKRGADSYRLAAVGGGRMAVRSPDGAVTVLTPSGHPVATVPAPNGNLPRSLALSRTRLAVVRWSGTLELYNPGTGKKTKSLTLGPAATLELAGVNAKLALLRGPQRLVLVRLSDGRLLSLPLHAVIDPTLTDTGLFYAYNLPRAREKGRIVFEPTAKLLARF